MVVRRVIQRLTKSVRPGTPITLPSFKGWSSRHCRRAGSDGKGQLNNQGVARAKVNLVYKLLSSVAGGDDEVQAMLDFMYADNARFKTQVNALSSIENRFIALMRVFNHEGCTIRAHNGQNGKTASKRIDQVFKTRVRVCIAKVVPSFAEAHRLAPDLANSETRWREASATAIGGGAGSYGKVKGPFLADIPHKHGGRPSVEESRPNLVLLVRWKLRNDELSTVCPARPPMKHGPDAGKWVRVLNHSRNQTFKNDDAFGLMKQPVKRTIKANGKGVQGKADVTRLSRSVLFRLTHRSKKNSIRAQRFDKQRCPVCMLRDRDGCTLQRMLHNEWKYDCRSTLPPIPACIRCDDKELEQKLEEHEEKATEPDRLSLPTQSTIKRIIHKHQPSGDVRINHGAINAVWARLAAAQYHYAHARGQKRCVRRMLKEIQEGTLVIIRDLSEDFWTGEARETPSYMHTRHGLDEIYAMCIVFKKKGGAVEFLYITVVSEVLNKCSWTAKQLEREIYAHPHVREMMQRARRVEHWFDKGTTYASAEFVTFLLRWVHDHFNLKISVANHFEQHEGRYLADAVIATAKGLANQLRRSDEGYTNDVHDTCTRMSDEFTQRLANDDWSREHRVVRNALFIPWRGPNGDGTVVLKPQEGAHVIVFPKDAMHCSGMQRRMTITDGDAAWRGLEEDAWEMFASTSDAHDIPDDPHTPARWHTRRGVEFDPDGTRWYKYPSRKIKRRRNDEAHDLKLVVKPNTQRKRQRCREDMRQEAGGADETLWQRAVDQLREGMAQDILDRHHQREARDT